MFIEAAAALGSRGCRGRAGVQAWSFLLQEPDADGQGHAGGQRGSRALGQSDRSQTPFSSTSLVTTSSTSHRP